MSENQISNFLSVSLIVLVSIFFILLVILVVLMLKDKNKNKAKNTGSSNSSENNKNVKKDIEYSKNSIFSFMEFDKVEDNMIIRKNGKQYIMVIECQGVNYDLMSGLEKNSVEQGFLQFLNTLRYPIQLYIQTRTVNLGSSISRYKQKVNTVRDDYMRKQMEYNSMMNSGEYTAREINNAKFELVKAQNLYEYGLDIVNNTEKMNLNKNILKKHYYVIISYIPEENTNSGYDTEEMKSIAFSDLYTKAQALISSLGVCDVAGKVLDSEELAELLYIAYNRDESETYSLETALKAGVDELYSTAKNVLDKRIKYLKEEIEKKAMELAQNKAIEAKNKKELEIERLQREKEKEIRQLAMEILDENLDFLGADVTNGLNPVAIFIPPL